MQFVSTKAIIFYTFKIVYNLQFSNVLTIKSKITIYVFTALEQGMQATLEQWHPHQTKLGWWLLEVQWAESEVWDPLVKLFRMQMGSCQLFSCVWTGQFHVFPHLSLTLIVYYESSLIIMTVISTSWPLWNYNITNFLN